MISIPAVAEIEGITIFQDDVDLGRFYYLPRSPRIARGADGKPQFSFLYYQLPLPRENEEPGGGYLVFTTILSEDSDLLQTKVRPALQTILRSQLPNTTQLPEVSVAPVDFTDGEARLIMMRNDQFIGAVELGKPALFSDNTLSVAVELKSNGATLFHEALKKGASVAAIEYDLTFPVRLPAITIIGHVSATEIKEARMEFTTETVVEDTWGDDPSHEVAHRTSIAEKLESQGLVKLEILKGSVNLSADEMESLRAFAFRAMDDFIQKHFLQGGTVETDADRRSEWMSFLGQNITATFDLNVSYRDVINRQYNPSAQVNPSFLGAPLDNLILDINLGDAPWYFNNLELTVDTNLDFARYGDIVHSVVGHLTYDQPRPDGTRLTKRASVVFTADDTKPKQFKTPLAAVGRDMYHVDVEVNYKSGPVLQARIQSSDETTRHLTLDVPNPGLMEITFTTTPTAFDAQLTGIEIEIEYGDPRNNVPRAVETVGLDKSKTEVTYKRWIYAPWDKPFRYRLTYILQDADANLQRSTTEWLEASSATRYVRVPTPFDQMFNLTVLPAVDWQDVRELVLDLEYVDTGSDYRMTQTYSFSKEAATMKQWKFPLRNPDQRSYRYSQKLLMNNGAVEESPWQPRDTDTQTLVVGNAPGGVVTIQVDPSDIPIGAEVRRVVAHLRYTDPAHDLTDTETLTFRDTKPLEWTIARADAKVTGYTYDVDYFMADGARRQLTNQPGTIGAINDVLFLPAPPTG